LLVDGAALLFVALPVDRERDILRPRRPILA
jgi:hypothetical protein